MSTHEQSMATAIFDVPVAPKPYMTEDEFVGWSFKENARAEWLDGRVMMMSPVSDEHSELFFWLARVLGDYVERRDLGIVRGPELFVRFTDPPIRRLPDLFFVSSSRRSLMKHAHFEGAPEMIMEIVSPESKARDWREKYHEYEGAGMREYWVIDPMSEHVELYVLSSDQKYVRVAERDGWPVSAAVPGFRLKTAWLWRGTRPKAIDALEELNAPRDK